MLKYKIDILEELKKRGYTSYILRQKKAIGENTIQSIRDSKPISWKNIEAICKLLNCQPGDILEYVPDEPTEDETKDGDQTEDEPSEK